MENLKLGVIGIGRIGKIHLQNACLLGDHVSVVAASNRSQGGQDFAKRWNVPQITNDAFDVIDNPDIDAVLICSSSDTHHDFSIRALEEGKYVFCEKPLDLDLEKVRNINRVSEENGGRLMVAFNQRYDPHFNSSIQRYRAGDIGDLRSIKITSRDPEPPPLSYVKTSGGLFLDMTIHDIDMARYIAKSEIKEVYAKGQVLIDEGIGAAGDIDTGYLMLSFENGVTAVIENTRQASYGYDQRLELFGSKGMVQSDNLRLDTHSFHSERGKMISPPKESFLTRYLDSYRIALEDFVHAIKNGGSLPVTSLDGVKATEIAYLANLSMEKNLPVELDSL